MSFVSLTSASLADVAPSDAGAASGLINVSQQLGAAIGLAVLVTIFGSATDHAGAGTAGGRVRSRRADRVPRRRRVRSCGTCVGRALRATDPSRAEIDDFELDELFIEDDAAALAEQTVIELV